MSFFYGVNSSAPTKSSSYDPFDKTVLPGYTFENAYMTGDITIVVITMMIRRTPVIHEPKEPDRKYQQKEHPSGRIGGTCFWYIL
jgi:hypothetical protein